MEGTVSRCVIRITLLNISSDWMGVLEAALRALQYGHVIISALQEKNLIKGVYSRYSSDYKVWETEAERIHRVGIAIVW